MEEVNRKTTEVRATIREDEYKKCFEKWQQIFGKCIFCYQRIL